MSLAKLNALRLNRLSTTEFSQCKSEIEQDAKECLGTIGSSSIDVNETPSLHLNLESVLNESTASSIVNDYQNDLIGDTDSYYVTSERDEDMRTEHGQALPLIKSVGEVHRSYRERSRAGQSQPKSRTRQQGIVSQKVPFYSGGKLKPQPQPQPQRQHHHHSQSLTSFDGSDGGDIDQHFQSIQTDRISEEMQWQHDAESSECVVIDRLCYSTYCANLCHRQDVEARCRRTLANGKSLVLRTNVIELASQREGIMCLKTIFMSISNLTTNFDGIIPQIETFNLDIGVIHEMKIFPRIRPL